MAKIHIAHEGAEHGLGHDPHTDHLRPVLDFLIAKGDRPAQWWHKDGFRSDPGGELHYTFTEPIDATELREHFAFPDSIRVYEDGSIQDSLNRVAISHAQERPPLYFDVLEA